MERIVAVSIGLVVVLAAVPTGTLAGPTPVEAEAGTGGPRLGLADAVATDPGNETRNESAPALLDYLRAGGPFELPGLLLGGGRPPAETYRGTVRWVRYGGSCPVGNVSEGNESRTTEIQYDAAALVLDTGDRIYAMEADAGARPVYGDPGDGGLSEGDRVTVVGHLRPRDPDDCMAPPTDPVLVVEGYTVRPEDDRDR